MFIVNTKTKQKNFGVLIIKSLFINKLKLKQKNAFLKIFNLKFGIKNRLNS